MLQVNLRQVDEDVQWQVLARGPDESAASDLTTLQDYFNLHEPLGNMTKEWAKMDPRFKIVSPFFPGKVSVSHIFEDVC